MAEFVVNLITLCSCYLQIDGVSLVSLVPDRRQEASRDAGHFVLA